MSPPTCPNSVPVQTGTPFDLEASVKQVIDRLVPSESTFRRWSYDAAKSQIKVASSVIIQDATRNTSAVAIQCARTEVFNLVPRMVRASITDVLNERFPVWFATWARRSLADTLELERRRLTSSLETAVRVHLDTIVSSDGYHVVNRHYFKAVERKGDEAISAFQSKAHMQLQRQTEQTNEALRNIDQIVDTAISKRTADIEASISRWRWATVASTIVACSALACSSVRPAS